MSNYSVELQTTVYNALIGNNPLTTKLGGNNIYDFVPEGTSFPYVKVGDQTMVDDGTKDKKGSDFTLIVHTFSRYRGSKEIKEIMSLIYDVLHESSLSVSGASNNMRFEFSDIIKEPDGLTTHGVQRFRVFVLTN
jgi:hypothetical protein|tara:strand:- start:1845 stop:2249 length:405 start_codon:yes stop_codon:yes gene_type:complete